METINSLLMEIVTFLQSYNFHKLFGAEFFLHIFKFTIILKPKTGCCFIILSPIWCRPPGFIKFNHVLSNVLLFWTKRSTIFFKILQLMQSKGWLNKINQVSNNISLSASNILSDKNINHIYNNYLVISTLFFKLALFFDLGLWDFFY